MLAVELFVNGTLMRGLKLNRNLDGSEFLGEFETAPCYRIFSIGDIHPGMFEVAEGESGGISVPGEMYRMSDEIWQTVESGEPPHLYKGPVKLSDGRVVDGILFPREQAEGRHREITEFGGWRAYVAAKAAGKA
ncbi:MAG: gamma-glutamylcyclotransferase [Chloroflexi bacterium]|nr:gamma-glutamylcyclotransferase [Chloroflexota bacterium]